MRLRLHEPAVALTDLAVGIEAAVFAAAIAGTTPGRPMQPDERREAARWFSVFFASTSIAALTGAALHGLYTPGGTGSARRWLWRLSLGSIAVAGLSAWCLGACLGLRANAAARVRRLAMVGHAVYVGALVRSSPPYWVAIATYLPGSVALGLALIKRVTEGATRRPAVFALAGLTLTFGAAVAQVRRIAVHPRHFDHNATYHAIQAMALGLFFQAARGFVAPPHRPSTGRPGQPAERR